MRSRPRLSPVSAPCRLDWRPSRWLQGALLSLGALAAVAVWWSAMPRAAAWPALPVLLWQGWRLARQEAAKPVRRLLIPGTAAPVTLDGEALDGLQTRWRGPLLVLEWEGAHRREQLLFWPDTLPPARRRELRLALDAWRVSQLT